MNTSMQYLHTTWCDVEQHNTDDDPHCVTTPVDFGRDLAVWLQSTSDAGPKVVLDTAPRGAEIITPERARALAALLLQLAATAEGAL
jgi:hypothetical protein